ncbi:hypothetical protein [Actinoplanes couchii]|uniref:Uncharacterized protein n=1 Tax=Actinoplanes couchii TaxID=403638 RepID=A0ABQ3XMD1_9ACTN|nr:hypothetical protein [Actinoplanes couchii]MDR6319224.1 hypothetical protein [Actinoplanes couchii]GID59565.1 hypothetical protein Aco03nite_079690 [Actinoplanes couchii]
MSRTDQTRPLWVRMAEKPGVTCIPVHDHRFGPCTLPERITADMPSGNCYWGRAGYHVVKCDGGSCSRERQVWRQEANRRDRHQVRRMLRTYDLED